MRLRRLWSLALALALALAAPAAAAPPEEPPMVDACGLAYVDFIWSGEDLTDLYAGTVPSLDICNSWVEGVWRIEDRRPVLEAVEFGVQVNGALADRTPGWAVTWDFDLFGCNAYVQYFEMNGDDVLWFWRFCDEQGLLGATDGELLLHEPDVAFEGNTATFRLPLREMDATTRSLFVPGASLEQILVRSEAREGPSSRTLSPEGPEAPLSAPAPWDFLSADYTYTLDPPQHP